MDRKHEHRQLRLLNYLNPYSLHPIYLAVSLCIASDYTLERGVRRITALREAWRYAFRTATPEECSSSVLSHHASRSVVVSAVLVLLHCSHSVHTRTLVVRGETRVGQERRNGARMAWRALSSQSVPDVMPLAHIHLISRISTHRAPSMNEISVNQVGHPRIVAVLHA